MPMNPRLLRPLASSAFPLAEARDGSNNIIAATDYTDGNGVLWRAHVFNSSGTLNFTRGGQVEYLVVAGGGGGGSRAQGGGGGGAGGLLQGSRVAGGVNTITVGAGGAGGGSATPEPGANGSNTTALGVTAIGGGGGGAATTQPDANGRSGGSGGGGGEFSAGTAAGVGGAGTAGQGFAGGNSAFSGTGTQRGGGGGGAGGAGSNAVANTNNTPGGAGVSSTITNATVTYAAGGLGSSGSDPVGNAGANTGNGGNGAGPGNTRAAGNGGSGIVVVRYRHRDTFTPTQPWDSDALAYVEAVQLADGGFFLENGVRDAINDFVVGCKADGIWSAIKASCILMGARTLSGALTPLVGAAPTNNGPFVSGDYDRKTGLVGNGSSKYLNSGRSNNADGQDDQHLAAYVHTLGIGGASSATFLGAGGSGTGSTVIVRSPTTTDGTVFFRNRSSTTDPPGAGRTAAAGFWGMSRAGSSQFVFRSGSSQTTYSRTSQSPGSQPIFLFARSDSAGTAAEVFSNQRMTFYSLGESLDLALLDTRVTTLYNAIGAAI